MAIVTTSCPLLQSSCIAAPPRKRCERCVFVTMPPLVFSVIFTQTSEYLRTPFLVLGHISCGIMIPTTYMELMLCIALNVCLARVCFASLISTPSISGVPGIRRSRLATMACAPCKTNEDGMVSRWCVPSCFVSICLGVLLYTADIHVCPSADKRIPRTRFLQQPHGQRQQSPRKFWYTRACGPVCETLLLLV